MISPYSIGGPVPKYTDYHVWKTLMLLDEEYPIGRKKLSSMLNLGEGSTRSVISLLKDQKYIETKKSGICLTERGSTFRDSVYLEVAQVDISDFTIDSCDCAVLIPNASKRISYGCEERDIAIKAGATGATTLICEHGSLKFPGSDYPVSEAIEKDLREKLHINNGDALVIGTANDLQSAECGAITAALNAIGGLQIVRGLKEIMSSRSSASEILSLAFAVHDLIGRLPVCAKSKDNLGIRIENGIVIDNAYTGEVLEEAIRAGTTIRKIAESGPYKGTKVIVAPIELEGKVIAAIGVVDIRKMAEDSGLHPIMD